MKLQKLSSIPSGANPFRYDAYHMGTHIGTNVTVMMPNHTNKPCPYMIVIDKTTGKRIRIDFVKVIETVETYFKK